MPTFTQEPTALGQDGFTASVSPTTALGTIARTRDGRTYRYVKAGVADLVAGNLVQSPAIVPLHLGMTPVIASIGATQVTMILGATAAAAGQYAEGYLYVDTAPGNGYTLQIAGHPAALSGGSLTVTLRPEDALPVALTGVSRVDLVANPFSGVIQCPAALTGIPVGVAASIIPAGQYGWVQTYGPCATLIVGTPAIGVAVLNSATVPGGVDVMTTTNLVTSTPVGVMMQVGVGGKNNLVFLKLG